MPLLQLCPPSPPHRKCKEINRLMNNYRILSSTVFLVVLSCCVPTSADLPDEESRQILQQLDSYWSEVSRSVREGDFAGYAATCHHEGILVSGIKQTSYPLSHALERWKPGFDDTKANRISASVEFRFEQRLHDSTTAHETGIFRYISERDGNETIEYIHFEGLLKKTSGGWKIIMEYQKSRATKSQWDAMVKKKDTD